jgi:hypothetical protein
MRAVPNSAEIQLLVAMHWPPPMIYFPGQGHLEEPVLLSKIQPDFCVSQGGLYNPWSFFLSAANLRVRIKFLLPGFLDTNFSSTISLLLLLLFSFSFC